MFVNDITLTKYQKHYSEQASGIYKRDSSVPTAAQKINYPWGMNIWTGMGSAIRKGLVMNPTRAPPDLSVNGLLKMDAVSNECKHNKRLN
jgi:hypothetical protein